MLSRFRRSREKRRVRVRAILVGVGESLTEVSESPVGAPLANQTLRDGLTWHADEMGLSIADAWHPTVFVHLRIHVVLERQAEFRSFLQEAIPFYEAPGGIRVRLLSRVTEPERFIEQIAYIDERTYQEDEERTRSDSTMGDFLARWRSILAEPPIVEVYREASLAP